MNGLYDFYKTNLHSILIEQEQKRKIVVKDVKTISIVTLLLTLVVILNWLLQSGIQEEGIYAALILFIPVVLVIWWINSFIIKWHRAKVKQVTISKVVQFIDPRLRYRARASMPHAAIRASSLFPWSIIIEGEDLIQGQLNGLVFSCSEIRIHREKKKHSGHSGGSVLSFGDDTTSGKQLFSGLFAEVELPERISSHIYIFPNNIANSLKGRLGQLSSTTRRLERVKLEDPIFERHFNTYAIDQLQSRMVLTTKLIEDISNFREKLNVAIMLSLNGNKLYIAVPSTKDLFEPNVFKSYLDPDYIRNYLKEVQIVTDLVEDIQEMFRLQTYNP